MPPDKRNEPGGTDAPELEQALGALEKLVPMGLRPSHYLARDLLLALGRSLREADPGKQESLLSRASRAGHSLGRGWAEAVRTELTLACGEFVQAVDPRFLRTPGYDAEYTRASRARLEDRLRAAGALGFGLDPRETELLALADRVWSAHVERSSSSASASRAPGRRNARPPGEWRPPP